MTPLVSLIIPVYQAQTYIQTCLTSIARQTYTHLEVLLIDDCGTDRSMTLVSDFISQPHPGLTFRILRQATNRGPAAARNRGVDEAQGKYVFFLDSDDELMPEAIAQLVEIAEYTEAEMVVGNYQVMGADLQLGGGIKYDRATHITGRNRNVKEFCQRRYYVMPWNKLILRSFLINHNIRFREDLRYFEDSPWSLQMAFRLENVVVTTEITYGYHIHTDSTSTSVKQVSKAGAWQCVLDIFFDELNQFAQYKNFGDVYAYYMNEVINFFTFIYQHFNREEFGDYLIELPHYRYDSPFNSFLAPHIAPTHRLWNLIYHLPQALQYRYFSWLMNLKGQHRHAYR